MLLAAVCGVLSDGRQSISSSVQRWAAAGRYCGSECKPKSVPTVGPVPEGASAEALVNEPTLGYRDGVEWWVPLRLPDGWRYGYAVDDGQVQTIRLLAQDRSMIDVEFGADAATIGEVAVGAVSEDLGGEPWQVADDDGAGVAARELDGRLLVVRGPIEPVRSERRSMPATATSRPTRVIRTSMPSSS